MILYIYVTLGVRAWQFIKKYYTCAKSFILVELKLCYYQLIQLLFHHLGYNIINCLILLEIIITNNISIFFSHNCCINIIILVLNVIERYRDYNGLQTQI